MSELIDRSARVSTLELFFDLVFVFTITQLTSVLVAGGGMSSAVQVAVMLAVIWWMYDGYAWLTNAIATDLLRFRLLLLGGMGGFLVIALAVPTAYGGKGLAFGIGYALVVVLHAGMYAKGTSVSEVAAILRIVPFNITAAVLVLVGGAAGGRPQDILWAAAALLLWFTPWFTSTEGFVIAPEHFVERHGLVIIVALGESIVVVGAGAVGVPLDLRLVIVAWLSLALSAALWWLYFRDEDGVERAMKDASPARRARVALTAFGYWHYGLVLGVVAVAAGLKKAVGDPYDPVGRLDRLGARGRRCAVHGVHGRLQDDPRGRCQSRAARRSRCCTRDDSRGHGVDGGGRARCAHAHRHRGARHRGIEERWLEAGGRKSPLVVPV